MREISEVFEEKEGKSEKNQEFELDVKVKRVNIDVFPVKTGKNAEFMGSRSLILIRNIELQRNEGVSPPGLEKLRKSRFLSNYAELQRFSSRFFTLKTSLLPYKVLKSAMCS